MPIVKGTTYPEGTPPRVIEVLEDARQSREGKTWQRLWIMYGDKLTGRHWEQATDLKGYIGRTTGTDRLPILVKNRTSLGGEAILVDSIIEIRTSSGGKVLYRMGINDKPHRRVL